MKKRTAVKTVLLSQPALFQAVTLEAQDSSTKVAGGKNYMVPAKSRQLKAVLSITSDKVKNIQEFHLIQ